MPSGGPFRGCAGPPSRCGGPSNQWTIALVWSQRAPPGHKKCIIYVHFQQTVEKCTYHSSLHKYPKHLSGMLDLGTGRRRVALLQMLEMRSSEAVQQLPYLHLLTRLPSTTTSGLSTVPSSYSVYIYKIWKWSSLRLFWAYFQTQSVLNADLV